MPLSDFFADHCKKFEREDETEHRLEFTEIHKQYEKIVDRHLEDFIDKEGTSSSDFYAAMKACIKEDEFNSAILEMVLASADYDFFDMLMRARARNGPQGPSKKAGK